MALLNPNNHTGFQPVVLSGSNCIKEVSGIITSFGLKAPLVITSLNYTPHPALKRILRRLDKATLNFGISSAIDDPFSTKNFTLIGKLFKNGSFDSLIIFGGANISDFAVRFIYDQAKGVQKNADPRCYPSNQSRFIPFVLIPTEFMSMTKYKTSMQLSSDLQSETPLAGCVEGLQPDLMPLPLAIIIDEKIILSSIPDSQY